MRLPYSLFIYFFLLCWMGVHCGIYRSSYLYDIKYTIFEFTPSTILTPIPVRFQQVSFFQLHTYVHSICTICTLPSPFPTSSPLHGTNTPRQDLFCPPVLWFCLKKKDIFFLFKIATQEVYLWHFCIYLYYTLNWFMSSLFLHSMLVPFLW
jgi:hypothetical protein